MTDKEREDFIEKQERKARRRNALSKGVTPKFMSIIYVGIIVFCVSVVGLLIALTTIRLIQKSKLEKQAQSIIEKYNIEANEHNNKMDPDYAEVYFEGNVIYIPSDDVLIEYNP